MKNAKNKEPKQKVIQMPITAKGLICILQKSLQRTQTVYESAANKRICYNKAMAIR